ncbi:MAG: hypothetical protein F4Z60_06050, partial [Chloroflexi bacterium]|nr:hypothetical protein [Chloroflexota bacterium]
MPVPLDGGGRTLTVSSDLTAASEVTRTFCADCVAGTVSFATASREVMENAGVVNLEVTLDQPPSSSFPLGFHLSGTATVGTDYTVPFQSGNTGQVIVPAGADSVTIPVTIVDDAVDDDGETIVVRLSGTGSSDYAVAAPDSVTLTIRNDDPLSEAQVGQLPIGHPVAKYATLVKAFHDRLTT